MNRSDRQEVCGTGEQEASRTRILIHALLDSEQHLGSTLDLVDDRPIESADERYRVILRSGECRLIVQGEVSAALTGEATCQGGLARLPRTADGHDPRVAQCRAHKAFSVPWIHASSVVGRFYRGKQHTVQLGVWQRPIGNYLSSIWE
jgi:hypothetical protein